MGIAIAVIGVILALYQPVASVLLLVVLAPFGTINEFVGLDPRTYVGFALGLRAAFDQMAKGSRVPRQAQITWLAFTAVAGLVLLVRSTALDASEAVKARYLFQYFVIASLAAFAIVQLVKTELDRRRLGYACAAAIAWCSVVAIAQGAFLWVSGAPDRVTGTLGNPNYLATFLALGLTTMLLVHKAAWVSPRIAYCVVGLAGCACLMTISRTGLLAAVVGIVLHRLCTTQNRQRIRQVVKWGALIATAFVILAVYLPSIRTSVTFSSDRKQEKLAQFSQAVSDLGRLQAFLFSVRLIQEYPVLGAGFGTFTARNFDVNGVYLTTHDTYLEVLTGTGLVGSVLLAFMCAALVRAVPRQRRRRLWPIMACLAISAGFGDYLQSIDILAVLAIGYLAVSLEPTQHSRTLEPA